MTGDKTVKNLCSSLKSEHGPLLRTTWWRFSEHKLTCVLETDTLLWKGVLTSCFCSYMGKKKVYTTLFVKTEPPTLKPLKNKFVPYFVCYQHFSKVELNSFCHEVQLLFSLKSCRSFRRRLGRTDDAKVSMFSRSTIHGDTFWN